MASPVAGLRLWRVVEVVSNLSSMMLVNSFQPSAGGSYLVSDMLRFAIDQSIIVPNNLRTIRDKIVDHSQRRIYTYAYTYADRKPRPSATKDLFPSVARPLNRTYVLRFPKSVPQRWLALYCIAKLLVMVLCTDGFCTSIESSQNDKYDC